MWDELYARERELQAAAAATRPAAPEPEPGFWKGVAKATGAGIMSGGAKAAQLVGVAGSVIPIAADTFLGADNLTGESLADGYFRRLDEITSRAVEYWSLPADGVGAAGRILHGVGEMALPLMATGGNPALFAASQGINTGMEMVRKGVDADTAGALAMVNTAAAGAGMMIPAAMGANRAMSAAIGAIVNPTMGVADRAATRAILEHQNYPAIAAQYRPFDPEAMATEAIIGGIFGTLFHGAGPKEGKDKRPLTPDEQAALLTKIHADTREADTLAKPGDIAAQNAGREAQALAMAQIDAGQPVSVAHLVAADAPTVEAARMRQGNALVDARKADERFAREEAAAENARMEAEQEMAGPSINNPEYRQAIELMSHETGWQQKGGRLIREVEGADLQYGVGLGTGKVLGRTEWIPNAEWWPGRPKGLTEKETAEAIRKALAGEKLRTGEQRLIDYMMEYARERWIEPHRAWVNLEEAERARIANDLIAEGLRPSVDNGIDAHMVARASRISEDAVERAAITYENDDAAFMAEIRKILHEEEQSAAPRKGTVGSGKEDQQATAGAASEKQRGPEETIAIRIAAETSDRTIRIQDADGAIRDVKTSDLMAEMEREFKNDIQDSKAFEAAATCFLMTGAAV